MFTPSLFNEELNQEPLLFRDKTSGFYGRRIGNKIVLLESVTTWLSRVLDSESLTRWRQRIGEEEANRIATESARTGTRLHKMLEEHLSGQQQHDELEPYLDFFRELRPIMLEHKLWNTDIGLAGTTDCIGVWNDRLTIVDFKTTTKPRFPAYKQERYGLQLAAYATLFEHTTDVPINQGMIILLITTQANAEVHMLDMAFYKRRLRQLLVDNPPRREEYTIAD